MYSCIDFAPDPKYICSFNKGEIVFQDNNREDNQKEGYFCRRDLKVDKEKCKAYTSMRFDSLSNLWLMDNEGRVTCWTTPLSNSESKKPKEVTWQESDLPMIPCRIFLNPVLGKMLRTDLLKDTLAWKSNNQSVKIYQIF